MSNPLYNVLGGASNQDNRFTQILKDVQNFQKMFNGDPKAEVQKMMNDGRLSQAQFNQYAQMANQIISAMGGTK